MKTAHTPGPWTASKLYKDNSAVIKGEGGEPVLFIRTAKSEDDLHLIAAAPELLAALVEVVDRFDSLRESLGHRQSDLSVKSRAAIAKATGSTA